MFAPKSSFDVDGQLFGHDVKVTISVRSAAAEISPAADRGPYVLDAHNIATMLMQSVVRTLAILEMSEEQGVTPVQIARAEMASRPVGAQPEKGPAAKVLNFSDVLRSTSDLDDGKGD